MRINLLPALFILLALASSCSLSQNDERPLKIAISKGSPYDSYRNYHNWLRTTDSTLVIEDMYDRPLDSALSMLEDCDGLLLTGGTDVNPEYYGRGFDTVRCWPLDHKRDSLELLLIARARMWGMPILGICRGEQVLNVAAGGSLFVDLPEDLGQDVIHRCDDYLECFHGVRIEKESMLGNISKITLGTVNSNHHQGIRELSDGYRAVAWSDDGLVEAIEWTGPGDSRFILGVQWHPERMGYENPLSGNIADRFLLEARIFAEREQPAD